MKKEPTKCVVVHLPVSLVKKIEKHAAAAGLSKGLAMSELLEKGLLSKASSPKVT